MDLKIAYFITPHGFGHAGRASAVMTALEKRLPRVGFEIFTHVPDWFFENSGVKRFGYHDYESDIGYVQTGPLQIDLPATLERLDHYLPFDPSLLSHLSDMLKRTGCRLVLCDISPLGIAAAQEAGLPSVLIENFTWDWIYNGHPHKNERLARHAAYLQEVSRQATYHIQVEPVCEPRAADLTTNPMSRPPRDPGRITTVLGLPEGAPYVLITMGGIRGQYEFLDRLETYQDVYFVIPGGAEAQERRGNLVLLPHNTHLYHPDLIWSARAVIGKLGYSTLAEVYHAGTPFGYLYRPLFRESEVLAEFMRTHGNGLEVSEADFFSGQWQNFLPALLALPVRRRNEPNGAEQAADFIVSDIITL